MLGNLLQKDEKGLSRRELLTGAGKLAAGAALISAGGLTLVREAEAEAKYPWGYKKLDIDKVAKIAHENWYDGFCCYAVASGILIPLREKMGKPYTMLPLDAFRWGHGGAVGWGTLCGSLTGCGIATGFIAGKDGEKVLNDVIAWYAGTELPIYKPKIHKAHIKNTSTSNSPLCHISVGRWMKKEGAKFFTPQRMERCARLSADVAVKTVELLNAWADGKYVPVHGSQPKTHEITTQNNCADCHK